MKVWELMAELSKFTAGADVCVSDSNEGYRRSISNVLEEDKDLIVICGDGSKEIK